jgi:hypothetical protein
MSNNTAIVVGGLGVLLIGMAIGDSVFGSIVRIIGFGMMSWVLFGSKEKKKPNKKTVLPASHRKARM